MRSTGRRSSISRPLAVLVLLLGGSFAARPVSALDLFTLWQQPGIPLWVEPGSRVDYRGQVMAGGRRSESLTRIQCLPAPAGAPAGAVVFEVVPLEEDAGGAIGPIPGEGAWLLVSGDLAGREGRLRDHLLEIWKWTEGRAERVTPEQLGEDPLVAASFQDQFLADRVEAAEPTTRIVTGRQFLCEQFVMTSADTQSVDLPAGRMVQVSTREISVAVHPDLPLLGLAYASERIRSSSDLDPPSARFRPPPPRTRVEIMELIDFGEDAAPLLGRGR